MDMQEATSLTSQQIPLFIQKMQDVLYMIMQVQSVYIPYLLEKFSSWE